MDFPLVSVSYGIHVESNLASSRMLNNVLTGSLLEELKCLGLVIAIKDYFFFLTSRLN